MIISSSAYPQEKTPKVESQVHELLQKHLQNHPMPEVDIRQYMPKDLEELKKLQKEWFPLNYSDEFYSKIVDRLAICFVAEAAIKPSQAQNRKVIVGAVVFQIATETDDLEDNWFSRMFGWKGNAIYVMTLGVVDELRSSGLANRLLKQMISYTEFLPSVKLIELHVVSYNKRAIKFYKKNGFSMLEYIQDHYHIMGKEYDGLKLGLFVNGGRRRQKWLPWLKRVVLRMQVLEEWPV